MRNYRDYDMNCTEISQWSGNDNFRYELIKYRRENWTFSELVLK